MNVRRWSFWGGIINAQEFRWIWPLLSIALKMQWYSWFFGSSWLLHFMNNNIDWFQRTEVGRAMARGARLARMTKSRVTIIVKVVTEWKILNLFQKNNLLQSQISCNTKFIFKIFMNETMNLLKTNYQKVFMMAGARSCSFRIVCIYNL